MSKKKQRINSPFGYFGSKHRIAKHLIDLIPKHNCWVEAFCGSAILTLSKSPAPIEVINDIDGEIVNFFQQLRDNSHELLRMLELTPYASDELVLARQAAETSSLERARRFAIQAMMSMNGLFGAERGGFSHTDAYSRSGKEARVSRWYNLPNRLVPIVERLRSVRVDNLDAREIVVNYLNRPATVVYLDPPYFVNRSLGYSHDQTIDLAFQVELLELCNRARCMLFLSGYENDLYNSLLLHKDGWRKTRIDTYTKGSNGQSYVREEVVWMNKHFLSTQKNKRLPIKLSVKEKADKKLNPVRQRASR